MKLLALVIVATAAAVAQAPTAEHLGTVSFPVSCAPASQPAMNRGVALLHDFWYEEAKVQFTSLAKADPTCAMAHWGLAMSGFHQIWDRPDPDTMKAGSAEIQKAQQIHSSAREQAYIAALGDFYRPGPAAYPARIHAYATAMGALYARFPQDPDAGAFYALALLADGEPNDTSLSQNRKAMAVLAPLFARFPDNPGVDHYITHACDNPVMAADGLPAANHYLLIAQSGPHAYHMPGHIYARLGLWPQDIRSQQGSIAASEHAESHGGHGIMDEPHSYDFLLYALLQSGQDRQAQATLARMPALLDRFAVMAGPGMKGMKPYYGTKYTVFYDLELRDWKAAAALEPPSGAAPEVAALVFWARALADGHLHRAADARLDLAGYNEKMAEVRKTDYAYIAEGTGEKITHNEILGWTAYAEHREPEALSSLRAAADLQDKVGQGEVDIPAREMLADMLLESNHPHEALQEYQAALKLSPNRLNGLYGAARAAQAAGNPALAAQFYRTLLRTTDDGAHSSRPELAAARAFVSSGQLARQ